MTETVKPAAQPRSFIADAPAASMSVGLHLFSRRSAAIADFWRSCAEVREPTDLMAVQFNYWTQLMEDYQEALSEGMAQIAGSASDVAKSAADTTRAAHLA